MHLRGLPISFLLIMLMGFYLSSFGQNTPSSADTSVTHVQAEKDTSSALVVIADVNITGYKKTKLYIIQREIPFHEGEYMLRDELNKKIELCKNQLMNTSLFIEVNVDITKQLKDMVFIDVRVKERWYLFPLPYFKLTDRNLNSWWVEHHRSLDRVNYGIKFMQNNVSGRNDKLNIWLMSGYTQQVSFRYENPFLDKNLKNGMNVGFSYSRNHELNYATDSNRQQFIKVPDDFITQLIHVDMSYSYRPAIKARHNFRISYTDQKIADTVLKRNPKYFDNNVKNVRFLDFSYTLQYYDVDYISYPLKGFMGESYIYKRGFNKQNNLWAVGLKADVSFPVFSKSYLQFQTTGVIKFPFEQAYYSQKLFGSSDFYLRGLEYYIIDGVAGGLVRGTAKKELASFSVRNYLPVKGHDKIPFRIYLKAYGDMGYGYSRDFGNSILNNKWLKTWGAGVDIISFYDLVLKLEYSFNQLGEHGFFIHTKADL